MWYIKLILAVFAYLAGSINFARVIAGVKHIDITKKGSCNPGTMNVIRTIGKAAGVITFLLDCSKTILFALLGMFYLSNVQWAVILGFLVVFGHMYPVYYKFKGGKGVASVIGLYVCLAPVPTAVMVLLLVLYMKLFKYGFIGSLVLVTVLTAVIIAYNYSDPVIVSLISVLCLLIFFKHRGNIARLKKGEENTLKKLDAK